METIGDAYMIVGGHKGTSDHAEKMVHMAKDMLAEVAQMKGFDGRNIEIRIGIHTGVRLYVVWCVQE